MTDAHSCPLCTEPYDDRNALCVHLEVEHRKSEVVSYLIDLDAAVPEVDISSGRETTAEDERTAPSA
ncbi:hypothetical protein [Natrinema salsiterrestre]|uniref:C2H2-type domain-containing protein n=1 Tax=Natrinema salsiterrestre TaxID=2950540 RepID=A0A9Q4L2P8_9EURY|nr:hypothetical protein [Natrinema salsiterrestre]MDF9746269.1 hypothetical protein [Natrinema salsiterrestre]